MYNIFCLIYTFKMQHVDICAKTFVTIEMLSPTKIDYFRYIKIM